MSSMKIELSTIGRTHVQWDDTGLHNTVRIAIAPDDLTSLAAANGYVKLEPGQVVVTMSLVYAAKFRMDDEILQGMETNDEAYAEALDVIHKFERGAALDASGVGR